MTASKRDFYHLRVTTLPFVCALLAAANADLTKAEAAFVRARYDQVLSAVSLALEGPLSDDERVRAHELRAMAHSAFNDSTPAVESFRRVLSLKADYALPQRASPKLRELLEVARRLGPLRASGLQAPSATTGAAAALGPPRAGAAPVADAPLAAPAPASEPVPPFEPSRPAPAVATTPPPSASGALAPSAGPGIAGRWWFWVGVGVLAAGAAAGATAAVVLSTPPLERGNLGLGALK